MMRVSSLLTASVALIACFACVACAGRATEMPVSAPDRASQGDEATASPEPASTSSDADPPGDLVCRAVRAGGGSNELFLEWHGDEARGELRESAPSGMVHHNKVRAERHQGLVVVDDLNEQDLAVHTAVVAERGGKKVMKVADAWSSCQ